MKLYNGRLIMAQMRGLWDKQLRIIEWKNDFVTQCEVLCAE